MHAKKTAFIVEHDFIMATYLADRVIVFDGKPGIDAHANKPESLLTGCNTFLKNLDVTFRRDPTNFRPRINKANSQLDQEQKLGGNYVSADSSEWNKSELTRRHSSSSRTWRRVVEKGTPQGNYNNNHNNNHHGPHRDDASGTGVLGVQKGQAGGVRSDTASGEDVSEDDDEPDDGASTAASIPCLSGPTGSFLRFPLRKYPVD